MENKNSVEIPGAIDLVKKSWSIFKLIWKKMLLLYGVLVIPLAVILVLLIVYVIIAFFGVFSVGGSIDLNHSVLAKILMVGGGLFAVLAVLATMAISMIISYSQIFIISEADKELKLKEIFWKGKKYFWRFVLMSIISAMIIYFAYIFFIIPGIIASVFVSFALYALLLENLGAWQAIKRSYNLVKGWWWTIFFRIILFIIVSTAIGYLFVLVNYLLGLTLTYLGVNFKNLEIWPLIMVVIVSCLQFILILANLVISYIVGCLFLIYNYLLYEKLKNIKEKNSEAMELISLNKKLGLVLILLFMAIFTVVMAYLRIVDVVFGLKTALETASSGVTSSTSPIINTSDLINNSSFNEQAQ